MNKRAEHARREATAGAPRVRKTYKAAEVNEILTALQQNTESALNEAQAMSIIKSLFVLGFRIINIGKMEKK